MMIEYLLLKKMPWRETSLMVSGISPLLGRLDFVVRGARSPSKRRASIDIFRIFEVDYREDGPALQTIYTADLVEDYGSIGSRPGAFLVACELASFLIRNGHCGVPCVRTYAALRHLLPLFSSERPERLAALVKLTYLAESGLLPEAEPDETMSLGKRNRLQRLLDAATGGPMPDLDDAAWGRIVDWVESLCIFHELTLEKRGILR